MISAPQLVERLLENDEDVDWTPDPTDPDQPNVHAATDLAAAKIGELNEKEWHLAFYIDTTDEYNLKDNLHDAGVAESDEVWRQLNNDIRNIEANGMRILRACGFTLREEGHTDHGLGGSLWVKYTDRFAFSLVKQAVDSSEPWSTTSGSIGGLKESATLFDNVSALGQRVLDVSISIVVDDEQKLEIEDLV